MSSRRFFEICAIDRVAAGYGKVAAVDALFAEAERRGLDRLVLLVVHEVDQEGRGEAVVADQVRHEGL